MARRQLGILVVFDASGEPQRTQQVRLGYAPTSGEIDAAQASPTPAQQIRNGGGRQGSPASAASPRTTQKQRTVPPRRILRPA